MNNDWLIRRAVYEDIPNIMRFIREHWSTSHILGNDRAFFEYEMCSGDEVNYIVAENPDSNAVEGLLGYIPYGMENRDVMLALWKNAARGAPMLGVRLLEYVLHNCDARHVACVGINKRTRAIYEYAGFKTGELRHYYRLGDLEEYRIAVVREKIMEPVSAGSRGKLVKLRGMSELLEYFDWDQYQASGVIPYKEQWYINKRYFKHPVYTYDIYAVERAGIRLNTVIIAREQQYRGAKALRIVDVLGEVEPLADCGMAIQEIIAFRGYEYADFYECGIPDEIMKMAGFTARRNNNIIPNYFAPFVQEEVPIFYCTTDMDHFRAFKGDGDQDRPNART